MTQPRESDTHICPTPEKLPFASHAAVKAKIKQLGGRKTMRPYPCKCGAWHITHKSRKLRGNR